MNELNIQARGQTINSNEEEEKYVVDIDDSSSVEASQSNLIGYNPFGK